MLKPWRLGGLPGRPRPAQLVALLCVRALIFPQVSSEDTRGDCAEQLEALAAWPHGRAVLSPLGSPAPGGCNSPWAAAGVAAQHRSLSWRPSLVSHPCMSFSISSNGSESEFASFGNWSGREEGLRALPAFGKLGLLPGRPHSLFPTTL